jgi:hypothetical protein
MQLNLYLEMLDIYTKILHLHRNLALGFGIVHVLFGAGMAETVDPLAKWDDHLFELDVDHHEYDDDVFSFLQGLGDVGRPNLIRQSKFIKFDGAMFTLLFTDIFMYR